MIPFRQSSFLGGIDQLSDDVQIAEDAYFWLLNGRQRYGKIESTQAHIEITALPAGLKQGIVSVGDVLIAFVAGQAFYNIDGQNTWIQIADFLMSTVNPKFWTEVVPASTFNFVRKENTSGSANDKIAVTTDFLVAGTPAGIVVQDGENQAWIIIYDSTNRNFIARETHTYDEWSNSSILADDREYVPIGKQMFFLNGKLYIVSRDNKRLYHSVSNRPLDFMVNIDPDGNKLPAEGQGGADSVSFNFDSDDITFVGESSIPDSFVYGTKHNVRLITLDYNFTIFGEPTYRQTAIVPIGALNDESVLELLGDYAIVDKEGIKSFNAVKQIKFEGRNSVFSKMLSNLTKGMKQTSTATTLWDNYAFFDLNTHLGRLFAVYDILSQKWVSLDLTNVDSVKQFCQVDTPTETKLYAITEFDELFQLYADEDNRNQVSLFTRSFASDDTRQELKTQHVHLWFDAGSDDTDVRLVEFVDKRMTERLTKPLEGLSSGVLYPVIPPVIPHTEILTDKITFSLTRGTTGKKLAYVIQWNSDAVLMELEVIASELTKDQTNKETNKVLTR